MRTIFLSILLLAAIALPAMADTYAHVETGQALDPQPDPSANLYLKRYNTAITGKWQVERVPDGVQHNAAYGGAMTPGSGQFQDASKYVNPDNTDGDGKPIPKP